MTFWKQSTIGFILGACIGSIGYRLWQLEGVVNEQGEWIDFLWENKTWNETLVDPNAARARSLVTGPVFELVGQPPATEG